MSNSTSRTQLEEAIERQLDDRGLLYRHSAPKLGSLKATGSKDIDLVTAILSAVDAHVKRVLGEDEIKLAGDGITDDAPALQALSDAPPAVRIRLLLRREQRLRAGLEENHG